MVDTRLICEREGNVKMHNNVVAALLALFLGGIGIHKFYLGKWFQGLLYLVFCWTGIPSIIAFIEAIVYLVMGQKSFQKTYG